MFVVLYMHFVSIKYYNWAGGWGMVVVMMLMLVQCLSGEKVPWSFRRGRCARGVIKPGGLIPSQVSAIPYGERGVILFHESWKAVCSENSWLSSLPLEPGLWGGAAAVAEDAVWWNKNQRNPVLTNHPHQMPEVQG